jgi:EAL domain-containing protein (putative c-di-GMP-specific phosphodiesterase class I)
MYRAKQSGRDRYSFLFEANGDGLPERRRVSLTRELREAGVRHEMTLAFQPVFELGSSEIVAIEALTRWTSPSCGEVSPREFIPLAENSGTIVPLGAWALRESCETAARIAELTGRRLELAVNVSGHQLAKAGFAQSVYQTLAHASFPAELLTLEVTEGALMQSDDVTARTLEELRSLGVRLTVDDFGAGTASLVGFRDRPLDAIKIDRQFLTGLPDDAVSFAVVAAISSMGTALGATVTAKGVETEAQLVSLRAMGCERVQGFLLAEPMRPRDLVARLRG